MGHGNVVDALPQEGLTCAIDGCHTGMTAEAIATRYGIARADQHSFAVERQRQAIAAVDSGVVDTEIVAVDVPERKGTSLAVGARRSDLRRRQSTCWCIGPIARAPDHRDAIQNGRRNRRQ